MSLLAACAGIAGTDKMAAIAGAANRHFEILEMLISPSSGDLYQYPIPALGARPNAALLIVWRRGANRVTRKFLGQFWVVKDARELAAKRTPDSRARSRHLEYTKCPRRFCCQQVSLDSVQNGFSLP